MSLNTRYRFLLALLAAAGSVLTGCTEGPKGRVTAVAGTVTLDGAPLVRVYVQFLPEAAGLPGSTAVTDEAGRYVLRTGDDRAGAVVGRHRVAVRGERADERSGAKGSPRPVPARYASPGADNPLGVVEVSETKAAGYDFELKSR